MNHVRKDAIELYVDAREFAPRPSWGRRLTSAVQRRARYALARVTQRNSRPPLPAAYDWLLNSSLPTGVPLLAGDKIACPGVTGAAIATAVAYGDDATARRWAAWLSSTQDASGAFTDAAAKSPSLLNTGQAIQGLLAIGQRESGFESHVDRACEYVLGCFDPRGRLRREATTAGDLAAWGSPALQLSCLPPVVSAARRHQRDDWLKRLRTIVRYYRRSFDLTRWDGPSHLFAAGVTALLDLAEFEPGLRELAQAALELPAGTQRADGSVPVLPQASWCSAAGVAALAGAWYRLGQPARADQAWNALAAWQLSSGGFAGSYGRGARYFPRREVAWGALGFLDITPRRVATKFAATDAALPEIDASDARVEMLLRWAQGLSGTVAIADLGCGRGRYLQHLGRQLPQARLVGVDLSANLLQHLPRNVQPRVGSLLRIPAADEEFDAVLAIESLEHSLLPRQALREICRVLRPGGRLMIIDKDAAAQPLSQHEPWEQWFEPRQLSNWLAESCEGVTCERLSVGVRQRRGVFVAWSGIRRGKSEQRRAA